MGRVQGGKKSGLWKKKSKISHNFFVTKAKDLKIIFLSPWKMHVEKCVTLNWYLFKTKRNLKLWTKLWAGLEKLHFNSITILYDLFLEGGAERPPPRLYIDSDPQPFIGLKTGWKHFLGTCFSFKKMKPCV